MRSTKIRRMIGLLILLVSLAILAWGLWPLANSSRTIPILPVNMQLPTPTSFVIWVQVAS